MPSKVFDPLSTLQFSKGGRKYNTNLPLMLKSPKTVRQRRKFAENVTKMNAAEEEKEKKVKKAAQDEENLNKRIADRKKKEKEQQNEVKEAEEKDKKDKKLKDRIREVDEFEEQYIPRAEYTNERIERIMKMIKEYYLYHPKNKLDLEAKVEKYKTDIKEQKSLETFSNLASLLQSFEVGKNQGDDLIFFMEDDYIHFETMLEEMIASYERIASQIKSDIIMCPSDYPYLYMNNEKTNILIGSKRHWRTIKKTLCTFMTSKSLLDKYWDNFYKTCLDRHDPFEKYINEIYDKEICISPIKSLSLHLTNINSSYGLAPFIDYKKLWDTNS